MVVKFMQGEIETKFNENQSRDMVRFCNNNESLKVQSLSLEFKNNATLADVADVGNIEPDFISQIIITLHDEGK